MELSKLLGGNYPYVQSRVPVFDGSTLAEGELLMRLAAWHSAGAKYYISAYTDANTEAEDTIGITMTSSAKAYALKENPAKLGLTSAVPDVTTAAGNNFLPVIVNPDALYMAFYDQTDAKSHTHAENGTAITISSIEDNFDGGYIYTTDGADSSATYSGELRYITADDGTDLTVDSTLQVDTSSDFIKICPIGHRLIGINGAATGIGTEIAAPGTKYLETGDAYGRWSSMPTHPLRYWNDKGLSGLGGKKATFWSELVQLKHAWRAVVI